MSIEMAILTPQAVSRRLAELQSVYEKMYAMPAGSGDGFCPFLVEHSQRKGFRLCAAVDEVHDQLVGFGYGFTGQPGQVWRDSMAKAVGAEMAAKWLTGHFEFAEFGVIPSLRRRGIGTRLYDAVFCGLPHRTAVLTVREENVPATAFYDRFGWQALYQGFFSQSGRGPYTIFGKILQ
jgi:ribosomal protein S18 acetylase RimI-like enzyme